MDDEGTVGEVDDEGSSAGSPRGAARVDGRGSAGAAGSDAAEGAKAPWAPPTSIELTARYARGAEPPPR